jgi:ribonuclease BN (tRNA processing enzyme)
VKRLEVFHFSPRYEGRYREIEHEAQAEFTGQEVCYAGLEPGGPRLP